jgi:antitoxin ParD1/3/4
MANSINLSLTDELRSFISENSGDGTLFATPSEFVRDILREKKERLEASKLRDAILDGFQDAIRGKVQSFSGDLRADIKKNQRNK